MRKFFIYILCSQLAFGAWAGRLAAQSAAAPVAAGSSRVGVALIDFPAAAKDQPRKPGLKALLAVELRKTGRFSVIRPAVLAKPKPSQEDAEGLRALSETRELYREGKKKFYDSLFEEALEELGQARRGYIRTLYLLDSNRELFEVHMLLGRTYLALDKEKEAREMFKKAIFIDPKAQLSTKHNPPAVLKMVAELKQSQDALERVQVEIESQPPGARVFANGKRLGITPVSIELPAGEYFIRMSKDTYRDWYSSIGISADNSRLERVLVSAQGRDSSASQQFAVAGNVPSLTQERIDFLSETAFRLGSDYMLLADLDGPSFKGQLFDLRTQELSVPQEVSLGASAAEENYGVEVLARKLSSQLNPEGYLALTTKTRHARSGKPAVQIDLPKNMQQQWKKRSQSFDFAGKNKKKRWYQQWWVWTIVGAVAAGGTYLLVTQVGGNNDVIVTNPPLP